MWGGVRPDSLGLNPSSLQNQLCALGLVNVSSLGVFFPLVKWRVFG